MRFSSAFFAATVVLPVFGLPAVVPITKRGGALKENSYIITLKDGVAPSNFIQSFKSSLTQPDSTVSHVYTVINGLAVTIGPSDLSIVRGMAEVASIEQDQILSLPDHEFRDLSVANESQSSSSMTSEDGEGVTIYGLDTGIFVEHECFEGRARWGWAAPLLLQKDVQGHGTHTAGTAIGKGFGVATKAEMVAVKVMNDAGTGSISDIIAGIDYACNDFKNNGRKPSIVTMSIGGSKNEPLDKAVQACIGWGVHFTVAAGNDNKDVVAYSPASAEQANTVGAVDEKHAKASFSNFGSIVDIQAPGVNIVSAGNLDPKSSKSASGTSMATPFVAGVLAVALSNHGQMSPADLSQQLKQNAQAICTGMPSGTTDLLATPW
ncbi:peptidase S8 family protein [Rhizoctonia solani AG-3 Rhs1AP]|uniref:Peptidase S8 family protein n=2 Tax=Rhizoctonia solani AG-3 TaxID=1086053 RepID=A0A074S814_9AGAM|nr:peptidase S8 family protein [Rhizoctonia solani AG-3 Rhs1AP]KEP46172.1 peptidase S8 family protein [Rhizoctonia solani 123E]